MTDTTDYWTSVADLSATWTNETNVHADDNNYAQEVISASTTGGILHLYNWNSAASVPASATIDNIEIFVGAKLASISTGVYAQCDPRNTGTFDEFATAWSGFSETELSLSQAPGDWGSGLTQAQAHAFIQAEGSALDYGLYIRFRNAYTSTTTFDVDYVKMTVSWTPAAAGGILIATG